jgi:hypothetical protein
MKWIFRAICFFGSIIYGGVLYIANQMGDWGDGAGGYQFNLSAFLWYCIPLFYFLILLATTFATRKSILVLLAGLAAHFILASFVIWMFLHGSTGTIFLIPSLFCAFMWSLMYFYLSHEPAA